MADQNLSQETAIEFVIQKTNLPRELVGKLITLKVPSQWTEGIRVILENPNRPEAIDFHDEMIGERVDFVKRLSPEEILETEELKEADEYMKKLQIEGGATPEHAAPLAQVSMVGALIGEQR